MYTQFCCKVFVGEEDQKISVVLSKLSSSLYINLILFLSILSGKILPFCFLFSPLTSNISAKSLLK